MLPRDTVGYVIILPEGDVPTQKCDIYPAKVASTAVNTSIEDPEKINVSFTITRIPALNLTIPA